jgi:hypothetical protein
MSTVQSGFSHWLAGSGPAAACPSSTSGLCGTCAALCLTVAGLKDDVDTLREMLRLRDAQVMGLRRVVRDLEGRLAAAQARDADGSRSPDEPDWTAPSTLLPRGMR